MSRTLKDRPDWVKRYDKREHTHVEHRHINGVCDVETLADARRAAVSLQRAWYPHHNCPAYTMVEVHCGGKTRVVVSRPQGLWGPAAYRKTVDCGYGPFDRRSLWCRNGVHLESRATGVACAVCDAYDRSREQCHVERDNDLPYWRRYRRRHGRRIVNVVLERPNRQKVRMQLNDAAAEWNTYGDTDVEPEKAVTTGASSVLY